MTTHSTSRTLQMAKADVTLPADMPALPYHDIDQFSGNADHLANLDTLQERLHLFVGKRQGLQGFLIGPGGNGDFRTQLAVDLDNHQHFFIHNGRTVVLRPGSFRQRRGMAEALP